MLTLTRKNGEQLLIDHPAGKIAITIKRAAKGKVIVGIDAAREIKVMRAEVLDQIEGKGGAE